MSKVLIIDTSILCVFLRVPDMDDCGPDSDKWDYNRVCRKLEKEIMDKSVLVMPVATMIETGNHIAQANGDRYSAAERLSEIIVKTANEEEPWAAFTAQSPMWDRENLIRLGKEWPQLAVQGISIGDATIKDVAEYYAKAGYEVEILTGDVGLKSYQPINMETMIPRRRR